MSSIRIGGRRLAGAGAIAVAVSALLAGLFLRSPERDAAGGSPAERRTAPELEGPVLVPPRPTLAELRGKPVVVNFWASWCVPCRDEAPEMARFDRLMQDRSPVVGVNYQDGEADARAFVRRFAWRFPNVRDPKGTLGARYRLIGLPTTFVVDRRGRIARQLTGPQTSEKLLRAVQAVG